MLVLQDESQTSPPLLEVFAESYLQRPLTRKKKTPSSLNAFRFLHNSSGTYLLLLLWLFSCPHEKFASFSKTGTWIYSLLISLYP